MIQLLTLVNNAHGWIEKAIKWGVTQAFMMQNDFHFIDLCIKLLMFSCTYKTKAFYICNKTQHQNIYETLY